MSDEQKKKDLVPLSDNKQLQQRFENNPLMQAAFEKYGFVQEQDENGWLDPVAVEKNMLAEAKLAGDMYDLMIAANITRLDDTALYKLMTPSDKMKNFLMQIGAIEDTKAIEIQPVKRTKLESLILWMKKRFSRKRHG